MNDTALFMAVVLEQESFPRQPVRVDPRPLKPDPDVGDVGAADAFVEDDEAIVRARRAALEHAGYGLTDAVRDRECGGLLIQSPDDPNPPAVKANPACPREGQYSSVVLSLARPPERELSRPCEGRQAVVRLLSRGVSPEGTSSSGWDYVLCNAGKGWRVVDKVNLYVD